MLDAGNPYVLPSAIVGAVVYLGVTALTDASLLVRLGVLLGIVGVVPVVLNRVLGRGTETDTTDATESTTDPDGTDDPTPSTGDDRKTN